jgi:hypothetical protein
MKGNLMRKVFVSNEIVDAKDISMQNSGQAKIYEGADCIGCDCDDDGFFIRLHSWDETRIHPLMTSLVGKKIRITVEVED